MNIQGGAIQLVEQVTGRPVKGGTAMPVYGYTTPDRTIKGGAVLPVYIVTDAEIASGAFKVGGGPAVPVALTGDLNVVGRPVQGGHAIPIYSINGIPSGSSPPAAPTGLTAVQNGSDVDLAWTDNATNEDGYKIYRSDDNVTFVEIDDIAAGDTTYTDTTISGGTTYWYYVAAYNSGGESSSNIVSFNTLLTGLVSYWHMQEASGNRANSIEGEVAAVPVNGPTATVGLVGNAAQLNTTSPLRCFTVTATGSSIPTTTTRTWAFAVKWDNLTAQPGIFQSSNVLDWYVLLLGGSNFVRFRLTTGVLNSVDSQAVITATGVWHIIRIWYDSVASQIGIQVDGNAKVTGTVTGTPAWGSTGWSLGRYGSFAHDGVMDEVAVWNRVLTDSEWIALRAAWEGGSGYPFEDYGLPVLEIFSPSSYRVFQRDGSNLADITIAGRVLNMTSDVEARWNGGTWTTIAVAANGDFSGNLINQSAGQGALEIRLVDYPSASESLSYVGIGDVFIVAGQSNPSGRGTSNQSYSHATLKACLFANDGTWKELLDPTDSAANQLDSASADASAAGSCWPLLATSIMADQSVPVAFVPCAMGGTSITAWQAGASHLDRTTLYGSMNYRAQQTGAKAVLWWQGESDALAAMAQATYNGHLDTLATDIAADIGCKIMPCKLQNSSGISDVNEAAINDAITEAWGDNINVLAGPDLSDIASDDPFHLLTNAKLATAAGRWWTALEAALYAP